METNSDRIEIVRLREEHIPALTEMDAGIFSDPWSEKNYRDLLGNPYYHYYVALKGNQIAGFAGMAVSLDEADIDRVMVAKDMRRLGIAGLLLEKLFELGGDLGVRSYTLEVRVGNGAAIKLYEKHGFRAEGVRPNFYEKPREDALIMWRR